MKSKIFGMAVLGLLATNAFAWNPNYECVSNDAKKTKITVSFLDSEVIRTRDAAANQDRYYRVTDSADELVEALILGHRVGGAAHIQVVEKGTMHLTLTRIDATTVTASVKVGKVLTTYGCK
ncbi:MAG: hypothetical protein JST04_10565 [Bdellovibrionales bacterium]|nr:hypothetical protein [Bdellovibrionales bacterium]